MSKPVIDDRFIVKLQGKDFVTYEGLLDLAHQKGLKSIKTEIIQIPNEENKGTCIVKAVCITDEGEFHGIGDASPASVNRMIVPHLIRMAETRGKARAMRDLTNVGMTAIEELGDDMSNDSAPRRQAPAQQRSQPQNHSLKYNSLKYSLKCTECDANITNKVAAYSKSKFGKELCFDCQKNGGR